MRILLSASLNSWNPGTKNTLIQIFLSELKTLSNILIKHLALSLTVSIFRITSGHTVSSPGSPIQISLFLKALES